jgi:hypothetical protein
MNNRFLMISPLLASSTLFLAGCSEDNSSFETPNLSDTPINAGLVSQKNLSILSEDVQPPIFDPLTGTATDTSLTITVKIGDRNNQLLTDPHTIFFATEWGLIEPSCVTEDGICTVTWQTSFGGPNPVNNRTTITAWTLGEESFTDTNGNGVFDDADTTFDDREEPFIDVNESNSFDTGEGVIDVVNGNDTTGANGVHDIGDSLLNSPSCTHSSLCSPRTTTYIWTDIALEMDGPPTVP